MNPIPQPSPALTPNLIDDVKETSSEPTSLKNISLDFLKSVPEEFVVDHVTPAIATNSSNVSDPQIPFSTHKDHPLDKVIGPLTSGVVTRQAAENLNECMFSCFVSQIEPKNISMALQDSSWIESMQEELNQFAKLKVWKLVDLPEGKKALGTRWVFKNKKDESGVIVRNKARLVVQGYRQEEGVDYDEVYASMARLEAI
ncbi:hypothetical protein E3N88_23381 [Mikania micrantha]|uniref:Reverse transcriptase Ty1/copia-type domain-containing protein n=1 Tax=Mikania micrantha TaxID=192012 RepID=A0A5N6NEU2_9ASTR|nr:hypothetical protein E3N88_23381 [Mikania micrantha]